MKVPNNFAFRLLDWYADSKRDLPWRSTRDPYRIWLSEIILQQTRVEQGLPYYSRFTEKYPSVHDLAEASEDEVMKLWEGLGYYSRARNLHASAKTVSCDLNGQFPDSSAGLTRLKGVGPYTANAIASFAFDEDVAVVDGNVYRFLSRLFGIDTPVNSARGKSEFQDLANELLPHGKSADFNQALMEFGAMQCQPTPNCETCPYRSECVALRDERIDNLPVKERKQAKKERYFNYLILHNGKKALLQKRTEKDIWRNLYQFPLLESTQKHLDLGELLKEFASSMGLDRSDFMVEEHCDKKHLLSHQILHIRMWAVHCPQPTLGSLNDGIFEASLDEIVDSYAMPVVLKRYIEENIEEFVSQ